MGGSATAAVVVFAVVVAAVAVGATAFSASERGAVVFDAAVGAVTQQPTEHYPPHSYSSLSGAEASYEPC